MKITFILELLLLFAVLAFASARVLEAKSGGVLRANVQRTNTTTTLTKQIKPNLRQDELGDDFIEVSDDDLLNNQNIADDENFVDSTVASIEPDNLTDEIIPTESDVQVEAVKPDDSTNEVVNTDDENPINKYCTCSKSSCNCCREFSLPIVPIIRGPGCATIEFRSNNRMNIAIKYGDIVLARRKIGAKDTAPICLPLPGGFTQFCGRVYGVGREKDDFKACLGLELRSEDEVEAALRVSCFTFGARGVKVANAEPLPAVENEQEEEEDDDDDILGFGGGGDDEDDEEDDDDEEEDDDDDELGIGDATEDDSEDESPDYTGFSLLTGAFDGLFGGDDDEEAPSSSTGLATKPNKNKKKTKKRTPAPTKPSQVDEDDYVSEDDEPIENTDFTKEPIKDFEPDTSSAYASSSTKLPSKPTTANKVKNSKKPTVVQSAPVVVPSLNIVPVNNPPQNQWSSIAATVAAITNKIKIPNSQAILNSAAITQNVIDDVTNGPLADEETDEKDVPVKEEAEEEDDETNDDEDDDDEDDEDTKDAYRDSDEDDDDEEDEEEDEEIDDEDETGRRNNTKTIINKKKVPATKLEKNKKKKEPSTLESFFGLKRLLKYF